MTGNIALYLDFENMAIPAHGKYPSLEKPLNVGSILDYAKGQGNVLIRRAYADWSQKPCSLYVPDLMEHAFDLVYIPQMTKRGKNGADLRMAMDALDDLQSCDYVDTFVIGSGDTDFIHLIRKLQQRGKRVAVVGFSECVGRIVQLNCNEFRSVEDLMGDLPKKPEVESVKVDDEDDMDAEEDNGRELIIRYIKANDIRKPVLLSNMKPGLKQLDSTFNEKNYGFSSFMDFVESFQGDVLVKIDNDPQTGQLVAILRSIDDLASAVKDDEVEHFLNATVMYQPDPKFRSRVYSEALRVFGEGGQPTLEDIVDRLAERGVHLSKKRLRRFLWWLGDGRLFVYADGVSRGGMPSNVPLALIEPTPSIEGIDRIYKQRVVELVMKKFAGVSFERVIRILDERPLKKSK